MKKKTNKIIEFAKSNKFVIIFFILLFFIGLITYKDYGVTLDEKQQRNHTIFNYYEYIKIIPFIHNDTIKNSSSYSVIPLCNFKIKNYPYKYYGVAIQYPIIIIEHLNNFKLSESNIYYMRHLYTFIIYFISMIYFYLILNKYILKDKKYSLIGTIFLVISPKIYGDAFYNIKDLVFMSLSIINIYYCLKFFQSNNIKDIVKLAIISALNINSRIIGGIIILIGIIFKIAINKKNIKKSLKSILLLIIFTYIFYFLMTPAMWYAPLSYPFEVLRFFNNYTDPVSLEKNISYYFGQWLDADSLPWHYIPVLITVSTPLLYIVLFIIGIINNMLDNIRKKMKEININILMINIMLIIILLFCMIFRPKLYGGWRHMYFIYPLIIVNSILGLNYSIGTFKKYKKVIFLIVVINLIIVTSWMIKNHPYQSNYFSLPFRKFALENFEVNYWKLANTDAVKYIAKVDKRKKIYINSNYNNVCTDMLTKDRNRLILNSKYVDDIYTKYYDYIIDTHIHGNRELERDYYEFKIKKMDGIRLYTIYKHK